MLVSVIHIRMGGAKRNPSRPVACAKRKRSPPELRIRKMPGVLSLRIQ